MATVTGMTAAAIAAMEASIDAALATKADIVGGVVPDSQVPAIAMLRGELFVNVKDKGAVGDGVTSDDAAIIAAIAAVNATYGGKVYFPEGKYLLSGATALSLTTAGTILEGAGSELTKIVIGSGFTGLEAISITANNCQVKKLSVVGANSTTTSNPVAGGINAYGARRTKITDCNFWYLNGWAVEILASTTSSTGNPDGTMIDKIVIRQCAGGIHFLGNTVSGYAVNSFVSNIEMLQIGVATGASANLDGLKLEDSWDVLTQNVMLWTSAGTGSSLHIKGTCAAPFIKTLDALGPSGAPNVLIEDGPNGSPQNVQIMGGVIQQGHIGLRITGAAAHVHIEGVRFINNVTHALSIEGTGAPVSLHNVFISASGTGASGSNYDINWSGSSTGYVSNCRFISAIVAIGTAGVQQSVNIGSGQSVRFINAMFLGSGAASSNYFTATPSAVLETSGGNFNFTTQPTFTAGAIMKSNVPLQPSASTNTVVSVNVNGSDGFDRLRITGDGKYSIGDGASARDTTWERIAAAQIGTLTADVVIGLLGKGIRVKEGTNGRMQTATLSAGTVTISNNTITANTRIIPVCKTPAGTVGALFVSAVTVGTSCTIKSTSSTDTSVIGVLLVETA